VEMVPPGYSRVTPQEALMAKNNIEIERKNLFIILIFYLLFQDH
jgi:hypothetical protein